jgi:hypothetical protein
VRKGVSCFLLPSRLIPRLLVHVPQMHRVVDRKTNHDNARNRFCESGEGEEKYRDFRVWGLGFRSAEGEEKYLGNRATSVNSQSFFHEVQEGKSQI